MCLILSLVSAEMMNVNTGEINTYELSVIQEISFDEEVMNIYLENGETESFELSQIVEITFGPDVSVEEMVGVISKIPIKFLKNYPNPFNPTTTIMFEIGVAGKTQVDIYNIKGQKVKTLFDEEMETGQHSIIWNGKDSNNKNVSSGMYFYKISVNGKQKTKKMIMLK
jgi:hypothetical protein